MKIVIAGAGDIGFHLATLLSSENHDIILIDLNQDVLDYAQSHLDVMTLRGDSASIEILKRAEIHRADLFLGVTTSEKNNIFSALMAKKLGAEQTVARVNNYEFFEEAQMINFKELGIDAIFSPLQLAAKEIFRLVKQETVTDLFEFEQGKISLIGITLDQRSPFVDRYLENVIYGNGGLCQPIALMRGNKTFLPSQQSMLKANDHLYFLTDKDNMDKLIAKVGKEKIKAKNIMIIGGNEISLRTAEMLEDDYRLTIVEQDKELCKNLVEALHNTMIIQGNYSNFELLKEEGLADVDVFIALTNNTETNILSSLVAKNLGVDKTIALVENIEYTHISQDIGIDTLINKKLIAANNIFRYVRRGKIEAITSLHGVNAEVIEFVITRQNRLTKKILKEIHFPQNAIIGAVIRNGQSIPFDDQFRFQVDDKAIIFALPEAVNKVEKLFD